MRREEKPAEPKAEVPQKIPQPAPAAQAPAAPAPAVQSPATEEKQKPKYESPAVQEADVKGYKWQFNQATEDHKKFIEGKVTYANLSDRVKSWFSLKDPTTKLKQDGDKYGMEFTPKTAYKGKDLGDFRFAVKVGGEWHYGLKPNDVNIIDLTRQVYGALKGAKRPVAQVIFYKIEGEKIAIHASLNNERRKEKPAAVFSKAPPKKPGVPFRLGHLRGN